MCDHSRKQPNDFEPRKVIENQTSGKFLSVVIFLDLFAALCAKNSKNERVSRIRRYEFAQNHPKKKQFFEKIKNGQNSFIRKND